jgi:hypothetical protein
MKYIFLILFVAFSQISNSQVLSEREQSRVVDEILQERFNTVLPMLMERTGIDMWLVISREYNEDPVLRTMLPSTWLSARRTTMIVFFNDVKNKKIEKLAIARYNVGESIKASWDMKKFPDQFDALLDIIKTRNPKKIAVNTSKDFGHADGLDHTHYSMLMNKLGKELSGRVVSAEPLAVGWMETRTDREMQIYTQLVRISHDIIKEGFSDKVVTPGITTTDDLVWWFRQKVTSLGLTTWFHPSVSIQRSDSLSFEHLRNFSDRPKDDVVRPGDLLHVDFGITYLRLNTDVQQHAYVLLPGEMDAPASIKKAFANGNRLQDILTSNYKTGRSGNEILLASLNQAKSEGIVPSIYTHPLGFNGHAAGPTIGMWDMQEGVPGSGDYKLYPNTAYSIELNASTEIPEWKKSIRIMLEEDGFYDGKEFRFIQGRQKELYLLGK